MVFGTGNLTRRWIGFFYVDDITGVGRSVDRLCRWLALKPLNARGNLSVVWLCYTLVVQCFLLFWCSKQIMWTVSRFSYYKTIACGLTFTTIMAVFTTVVLQSLQNGTTRTVLESIRSFDQRIHKLGLRPRYSHANLVKAAFAGFLPIVLSSIFYITSIESKMRINKFLNELFEVLPITFLNLVSRQPLFILDALSKHYKRLKEFLESLADKEVSRERERKTKEAVLLYHALCQMHEVAENAPCRQTLAFLLPIFVNLTGGLFLFTNSAVRVWHNNQNKSRHIYFLFKAFATTLTWVLLLLDIIKPCKQCMTQAKEFTTVLYNMMIEDKTKDLLKNERLQLHMVMKREVRFTACGFFPLDNTLIHSVIAAAATYLILLIQFGPKTT